MNFYRRSLQLVTQVLLFAACTDSNNHNNAQSTTDALMDSMETTKSVDQGEFANNIETRVFRSGLPCLDSLVVLRDTISFASIQYFEDSGDIGGTVFYFYKAADGTIRCLIKTAEGALSKHFETVTILGIDSVSQSISLNVQYGEYVDSLRGKFTCNGISGSFSRWEGYPDWKRE